MLTIELKLQPREDYNSIIEIKFSLWAKEVKNIPFATVDVGICELELGTPAGCETGSRGKARSLAMISNPHRGVLILPALDLTLNWCAR